MIRNYYPYLQDPYILNLNEEQEKRNFLSLIDNFINQRQYVKMNLLDWDENIIKSIEGEISSGSITKDGMNPIRCTASLSCSVDGKSYNVDEMGMDFSLSKKIFIEIGIKNDTQYYKEYPILWFPQGVFFISSFSMNSSSSSSVGINLSLKDKMAMLNGEIGGTFPTTTRIDMMSTKDEEGNWIDQKVLIFNIIKELVNHYGKEDLNNIIIEDVPLRIKKIMQWNGTNPLYATGTAGTTFSIKKPSSDSFTIYETGSDVGYIYSDFVLTGEVYAAAGDNVCTILDQIKDQLGNFEYYYDCYGLFHFREIHNYLNTSQASFDLTQMSEKDYLIDITNNSKTIYSFSDDKNITSISVTPQYENIKNDFIVHGTEKGDSNNAAAMIMYHLAIDEKPEIQDFSFEENEGLIYYTDNFDSCDNYNKLGFCRVVSNFPNKPSEGIFYIKSTTPLTNGKGYNAYYWDEATGLYKNVYLITQTEEGNQENPCLYYQTYLPTDWRTFLYIKALLGTIRGTDEGYYGPELLAFWPGEYELKSNEQNFLNKLGNKYYLDFIEPTTEIGKYNVKGIGRRSDVVNSDEVNCLFESYIPDVIFLNINDPWVNLSDNTAVNKDTNSSLLQTAIEECILNNQPYTQVENNIYNNLIVGGQRNSAYEKIKYELYYHTNYQKVVSLVTMPIFYLEPNSRVALADASTNTYGDFMIQSISITLGPGANMSLSLNEIHDRI